ncbi:MAG: cysteine synthase [Firmicutes bacterium]|nr:cysteine synthase [Bacillota bacterium]
MKIAETITDLIGNTPLLRLNNYSRLHRLNKPLLVKLEYFNPQGSVKDRIGHAMIEEAEERGFIGPQTTLIEPTSGNTGVGLASVAAAKGYQLIVTMPDNASEERIHILKALGAKVVLTPASGGMKAAIAKAEELRQEIEHSFMLHQFKNPANTEIHRLTTGPEVWQDTDGQVDIFMAGIGTGGTITGVGEALKSKKPDVKIIGVEPFDSPVLSKGSEPRAHQLQGIGVSAGFIPSTLNVDILDEIFVVKTEEAFTASRQVAKTEGVLVGISSGAALHAAVQIALRPENGDKLIVVLSADTGSRYFSTPLYRD